MRPAGKGPLDSLYFDYPIFPVRRVPELDGADTRHSGAIGVLSSQWLDRRIPDKQTLVEEIAAWEQDRNANHSRANWQFSTQNAGMKLKYLYPSL